MGVLVAKIVLVPLLLKMLTAISVAAVVMSKIALITTGLVALKWIFSGNIYDSKDRLEFIYLPTSSKGKPQHSAAGGFSILDDQSWSESDNQYAASHDTTNPKQKYIPVNLKSESPYNFYRNAYGGRTTGWDVGNSIKDLYYYAQHQHSNNIGKPFL